jgi:hypothetical protein
VLKHLHSIGTEKSKGTKVFALAGKISKGGLIEVPMGITIRQIVENIGDGIADGNTFKAVQIGGPSGGCIPASKADTPIDYEETYKAGCNDGIRRHGGSGQHRLHGRYGKILPDIHSSNNLAENVHFAELEQSIC